MSKIAIYPGSFNPFHKGHEHIVRKALKIFDIVYIFMAANPEKVYQYSIKDRIDIINRCFKNDERVKVIHHNSAFTVEMAKEVGATHIIKGVRNANDCQNEMEQALVNKWLDNGIDTIFFPCDQEYRHISSTLIRTMPGSLRNEKLNDLIIQEDE